MKTPLRYQITEFDCGSVSLLNCITYLFEREEIPAELVKMISVYTLDCYDEFGNLGQKGTSRHAVNYMCQWLCGFAKSKDFGLDCDYYSKQEVSVGLIKKCIKQGGCVNLRTYLEGDHYVVITDLDAEFVYMFDPYFEEKSNNKYIEVCSDNPFKYNKKVNVKYFDSKQKKDLCLGPISKRECVLFRKK